MIRQPAQAYSDSSSHAAAADGRGYYSSVTWQQYSWRRHADVPRSYYPRVSGRAGGEVRCQRQTEAPGSNEGFDDDHLPRDCPGRRPTSRIAGRSDVTGARTPSGWGLAPFPLHDHCALTRVSRHRLVLVAGADQARRSSVLAGQALLLRLLLPRPAKLWPRWVPRSPTSAITSLSWPPALVEGAEPSRLRRGQSVRCRPPLCPGLVAGLWLVSGTGEPATQLPALTQALAIATARGWCSCSGSTVYDRRAGLVAGALTAAYMPRRCGVRPVHDYSRRPCSRCSSIAAVHRAGPADRRAPGWCEAPRARASSPGSQRSPGRALAVPARRRPAGRVVGAGTAWPYRLPAIAAHAAERGAGDRHRPVGRPQFPPARSGPSWTAMVRPQPADGELQYARPTASRDAVAMSGEQSWIVGTPAGASRRGAWTEGQKERWARSEAVRFVVAHPGPHALAHAHQDSATSGGLDRDFLAGVMQGLLFHPPGWFTVDRRCRTAPGLPGRSLPAQLAGIWLAAARRPPRVHIDAAARCRCLRPPLCGVPRIHATASR